MPRVQILAAPRAGLPGVWALGTSPRTGPVDPATGVPTIIPGKSGRFFANGSQEEVVISDEQLRDLQSEPNRSLLAVVVIDAGEQPPPEGGDVANQNMPGQQIPGAPAPAPTSPGSTVPPGTSTPSPTPAPAPTPTAPAPAPGTGTPSTPTSPTETSPATKRSR
jgi:hypothetical protein